MIFTLCEADLLPCPFCQGPAVLKESDCDRENCIHYIVSCDNNDCFCPGDNDTDKDALIKLWNTRKPADVGNGDLYELVSEFGVASFEYGELTCEARALAQLNARAALDDLLIKLLAGEKCA